MKKMFWITGIIIIGGITFGATSASAQWCGDGTCNGTELCSTCPGDCSTAVCGDGCCQSGETCPTDCGEFSCGVPVPCFPRTFKVEDPPGSGTFVYQTECRDKKGWLYVWRDNFAYMLLALGRVFNASYRGASCNEVWCIPPAGCNVSPSEAATFDVNGNTIIGDVNDVIACLDWNIANMGRFENCARTCDPAACDIDLPRSVIPGFDPNLDAFIPPNNTYRVDRLKFLNCLQNCSNANCDPALGAMPLAGTGPAPGYAYPGGAFVESLFCNASWVDGNLWYDAVVNNVNLGAGGTLSCDMSSTGWLYEIHRSHLESRNLPTKMTMRRNFLQAVIVDVQQAVQIMNTALAQFDNFILTEVTDLINARIERDNEDPNEKHPFHMIYGWQDAIDADQPGRGGVRGSWHIVKVEGRIPKRCGTGSCEGLPSIFGGGDPDWPDIETHTSGFLSTKRCYEMVNRDGAVKFRVTRVDETRDLDNKGVTLPGGAQIWKFKSGSTKRSVRPSDWQVLGGTCGPLPNPPNAVGVEQIYRGAFFLNERPHLSDQSPEAEEIRDCWDFVHKIIGQGGVSSEVCAVYYPKEGDRRGFTFEFVPCRPGGVPTF